MSKKEQPSIDLSAVMRKFRDPNQEEEEPHVHPIRFLANENLIYSDNESAVSSKEDEIETNTLSDEEEAETPKKESTSFYRKQYKDIGPKKDPIDGSMNSYYRQKNMRGQFLNEKRKKTTNPPSSNKEEYVSVEQPPIRHRPNNESNKPPIKHPSNNEPKQLLSNSEQKKKSKNSISGSLGLKQEDYLNQHIYSPLLKALMLRLKNIEISLKKNHTDEFEKWKKLITKSHNIIICGLQHFIKTAHNDGLDLKYLLRPNDPFHIKDFSKCTYDLDLTLEVKDLFSEICYHIGLFKSHNVDWMRTRWITCRESHECDLKENIYQMMQMDYDWYNKPPHSLSKKEMSIRKLNMDIVDLEKQKYDLTTIERDQIDPNVVISTHNNEKRREMARIDKYITETLIPERLRITILYKKFNAEGNERGGDITLVAYDNIDNEIEKKKDEMQQIEKTIKPIDEVFAMTKRKILADIETIESKISSLEMQRHFINQEEDSPQESKNGSETYIGEMEKIVKQDRIKRELDEELEKRKESQNPFDKKGDFSIPKDMNAYRMAFVVACSKHRYIIENANYISIQNTMKITKPYYRNKNGISDVINGCKEETDMYMYCIMNGF